MTSKIISDSKHQNNATPLEHAYKTPDVTALNNHFVQLIIPMFNYTPLVCTKVLLRCHFLI